MSLESPVTILYDVNGVAMAVSGGIAVPVSTSALLQAGLTTTGTASIIAVDAAGAQTNQEGGVSGSARSTSSRLAQVGGIDAAGNLQSFTVTNGFLNVTGSFSAGGTQTVTGTVAQGAGNSTQSQGWFVRLTDGTQAIGTGSSAPLFVTGTVGVSGPITGSVSVLNTVTVTGSVGVSGVATVTGSVGVSGVATVTGSVALSATANVKYAAAPSAAVTSVAASVTNVTVLASNANRRGASVYNDSSSKLYLKFGATASTTSFTVLLFPNSYFEVHSSYTGIIDGLWLAANGSARVTEIT